MFGDSLLHQAKLLTLFCPNTHTATYTRDVRVSPNAWGSLRSRENIKAQIKPLHAFLSSPEAGRSSLSRPGGWPSAAGTAQGAGSPSRQGEAGANEVPGAATRAKSAAFRLNCLLPLPHTHSQHWRACLLPSRPSLAPEGALPCPRSPAHQLAVPTHARMAGLLPRTWPTRSSPLTTSSVTLPMMSAGATCGAGPIH